MHFLKATYSPEDNKLRIYPDGRLSPEDYAAVKAAGFSWAPKQELFVAPMWTPAREDFILQYVAEIEDEDTSLVDRAEAKADRLENMANRDKAGSESAHTAVSAIANGIPLGQPILVGHHSEARARRDAERIQKGMKKAVALWDRSQYWLDRAKGALRHAKYKELPAVRARRIKGLEADRRKEVKEHAGYALVAKFWRGELNLIRQATGEKIKFDPLNYEHAIRFTGSCIVHLSFEFPLAKYPRSLPASQYEGHMGLYSALGGGDGKEHAIITPEQARDLALDVCEKGMALASRWIAHIDNRLAYERAMLAEDGGIESDRTKPEVGGACRAWCSERGQYSLIQKVNKISVTLLDNWGNGGEDFTRTIPFDKLTHLMGKADVDKARAEGRILHETKRGFVLLDSAPPTPPAPKPANKTNSNIEALRQSAKDGVKVAVVAQLFPTPPEVAKAMLERSGSCTGKKILEPSAGTGNLIRAAINSATGLDCMRGIVAVEVNPVLVEGLKEMRSRWLYANEHNFQVIQGDFLKTTPQDLGLFDIVLMNPPFGNAADVDHIKHARTFLRKEGILVAVCADGPRQREAFKDGGTWIYEPLPEGSFKASGTMVDTALVSSINID